MSGTRVLVVDDEPRQLEIVRTTLQKQGFEVETAATAESAAAIARDWRPGVILTDLKLPGRDGLQLLGEVLALDPPPSVLILTAHGTIDNAVEAMKKGAFDYLTKPLDRNRLVFAVRRAVEKAGLVRENLDLRRQLVDRFSMENIIGNHGRMQDVFRMVLKVAPSHSTVLIAGESGTGKELIARAIHRYSPRADRPFHGINCAAIPQALLESELFGHEKGAFTGAVGRKLGLFEEASGGTLLLDEVGDLDTTTQAKLLRALQEREIRRVGGNEPIPVDVRMVAATNKDLKQLMAEGRFREDLYYRLNVVSITLPPLRERRTDIPLLVRHFLERHARSNNKGIRGIEDRALEALACYEWPGNVRQCESAIEQAVLMAEGSLITYGDLPQEVRREGETHWSGFLLPDGGIEFGMVERSLIDQALRKGGTVSRAARLLGLSYRTLQYRMKKFGLQPPRSEAAPSPPEPAPPEPELLS